MQVVLHHSRTRADGSYPAAIGRVAAAVPAMLRSSRASPRLVPGALGWVSTAATGPRGLDSPRGLDTAAGCARVLGWAAVAARGHERPSPPRSDEQRASGRKQPTADVRA